MGNLVAGLGFGGQQAVSSAAALGGSILSYEGQRQANQANIDIAARNTAFNATEAARARQFNHDEAQLQRDYETQMSNSAYQRAVKDMEAAGINPMLAVSQGGATTPPGATASGPAATASNPAPVQNVWSQALSGANAVADVALKMATADKTGAEAENTRAELPYRAGLAKEQDARVWLLKNQAEAQDAYTKLTDAQRAQVHQAIRKMAHEIENVDADTALKKALTGNAQVDNVLKQLDVPKANNEAATQNSWWMRNVAPYLPSVLQGASSAHRATGVFK